MIRSSILNLDQLLCHVVTSPTLAHRLAIFHFTSPDNNLAPAFRADELISSFYSCKPPLNACRTYSPTPSQHTFCEGEGDVVAVVASLGGVAQVVSHGVKVVGVHEQEGKEKDEEVRVEVKGDVEENQRQPHMYMA